MLNQTFSRKNLEFTLFDVLHLEELKQYAYFQNSFDKESVGFMFDMVTDIAQKIMLPAYTASDRQQPELVNGEVKVHPAVHDFFKAFAEAGLTSAPYPEEIGGMQLPKMLGIALDFILGSAHNSMVMFPDLTKGVSNLIFTYGTEEQKNIFLPKIFSGEWSGTMCLTETEAGSSLSDVATTATPLEDGTYKIKGQKIFISAGDHDITDNILHLVLARIDGAPKGTKGISLFVVPKNKLENSSQSNDVTSVAIYHKMGQKATPALHLEFGAKDESIGYLLGQANKGLPQMFLMMNSARLGVGLAGIQVASMAYYTSLQYAKERPQGRRLNDKNPLAEQVCIIEHPDVRRMLFLQKAIVEGGLSLILQCSKFLDLAKGLKSIEPMEADRYNALAELLTPVAKTFGAEMGNLAVYQGVQVLGGYGYTEDFELEQMARDARIMPIYEGTTGIQSLALLGRQIIGNRTNALEDWQKWVNTTTKTAENERTLTAYWKKLNQSILQLNKTTQHLHKIAKNGDTEILLADANLYMEAFGIINVAWQWLRQGVSAQKALENKELQNEEKTFYESKIQTMQFYFHYELPKTKGLFTRLMDKKVLTIFDENKELLM